MTHRPRLTKVRATKAEPKSKEEACRNTMSPLRRLKLTTVHTARSKTALLKPLFRPEIHNTDGFINQLKLHHSITFMLMFPMASSALTHDSDGEVSGMDVILVAECLPKVWQRQSLHTTAFLCCHNSSDYPIKRLAFVKCPDGGWQWIRIFSFLHI